MTLLSQSSKETSCCSHLLMENRNEYLTGNDDKWRFRIREGSLGESHPHGRDLPLHTAVLLSVHRNQRRGCDKVCGALLSWKGKVLSLPRKHMNTMNTIHLVVCRPECRIADQQGALSPLHHAVNSGATAVDREECMGKCWAGRVKIREGEQGCLCFHFRYLNWGNTRLYSLTCTQEGGQQWVENIWGKAFWLPGQ